MRLRRPRLRPATKVLLFIFMIAAVGIATFVVITRQWQDSDPRYVFWQALQHNLTEEGLTCTSTENNGSSGSKQAVNLDLISRTNALATTTLTEQDSSITTQEITTAPNDYVRYTAINTTAKNQDGVHPDFEDALNVWSKQELPAGQPGLFGRTALGNCIVPLAHLTDAQAAPLMKTLQNNKVFKVHFTDTHQGSLNGHTVHIYDVTVQPRPYIEFMKQVGKAYGLHDLDAVDAAAFVKKTPEKMEFFVSPKPARLQKIQYTNKNHSIVFSNYGKRPSIKIPQATISAKELQGRLQRH